MLLELPEAWFALLSGVTPSASCCEKCWSRPFSDFQYEGLGTCSCDELMQENSVAPSPFSDLKDFGLATDRQGTGQRAAHHALFRGVVGTKGEGVQES